jgi:hypothetical protein
VPLRRPELCELAQVALTPHQLARDSAMNHDLVADDVLQDAVVGRRRAADVVLRLEAVDRHHD